MPATLTKKGDALIVDLSTARGLEFKEALDKVRDVPGRRYNPDDKTWSVPADVATADRVIHSIEPIMSDELRDWVNAERVNATEALTTPLPDDAELRTPLRDVLYPYQRAFVDLAARQRSVINADDMGLGKTIQALAAVSEHELRFGHGSDQGTTASEEARVLQEEQGARDRVPDRTESTVQEGSEATPDGGPNRPVRSMRAAVSAARDGSAPRWDQELHVSDGTDSLPTGHDAHRVAGGGNRGVRTAVRGVSPHRAPRPRLVVCPASVRGVWAREIVKWLGSDEPHQIIDASSAAARHNQLVQAINENAWCIVNYEQLRVTKEKVEIKHRDGGKSTRTVELMKQPLFEVPYLAAANPSLDDLDFRTVERARKSKHRKDWYAVIADEAHRAKNRRASQTKGLHRIQATLKLAQTGTPLMNTPDELWSVLHWLFPDEYTSYWRFYESYVEYTEGYFGKVITGVRNPDALRFELRDRLVRRTKDQVLDLPAKTRVTVPVKINAAERKFYNEVAAQVWIDLKDDAAKNGDDVLAAAIEKGDLSGLLQIPNGAARMVRLQQVLEHPSNIEADTHRVDYSSKLSACEEIIMDNANIQHVVFVKFKHTAERFAAHLRDKGLKVGVYTGDVDPKDRTRLEDDFQSGDLDVVVGTFESMYQGITLTAASTEHFITRSWVPAVNEQAEDRCHRVGQYNPVTIYIYEAQGTVDDGKVRPANRLKEAIVKTVVAKDDIKEETHS